MTTDPTLQALIKIFRAHFHHQGPCSVDTSKAEVAEWSSLNHVLFFIKLEKHFGIRFTGRELIEGTSLGHIRDIIQQKRSLP